MTTTRRHSALCAALLLLSACDETTSTSGAALDAAFRDEAPSQPDAATDASHEDASHEDPAQDPLADDARGDAATDGGDAAEPVDAASGADAARLEDDEDASSVEDDGGRAPDDDGDLDDDGAPDTLERVCGSDPARADDVPRDDTLHGEGSTAAPYLICSPPQLALWIARGELASHARVTRDLDLSAAPLTVQLGSSTAAFEGALDGGSHTLSGLVLGSPDAPLAGIVSSLGAAGAIRDLRITGAVGYAGALLAGRSAGLIERASVAASSQGSDHVGLLVNYNAAGAAVIDCASSGSLSALLSHVGGLVGENQGLVLRSRSAATVSGDNRVGGLVGSGAGAIERSSATGAVHGARAIIGGLLGTARDGARIIDSYALGAVAAAGAAGGLVGSTQGTVTIERCYAQNAVSGGNASRGFLGTEEAAGGAHVSACYFDSSLTAADPLAVALSAEAMQIASSFAGFDFATPVWVLDPLLQSTPALAHEVQLDAAF